MTEKITDVELAEHCMKMAMIEGRGERATNDWLSAIGHMMREQCRQLAYISEQLEGIATTLDEKKLGPVVNAVNQQTEVIESTARIIANNTSPDF